MRIAVRWVLPLAFVLAFLACAGVLGGASASAEVTHNFKFAFNGSEIPGGSFGQDLGTVAVDRASGDVYVEAGNHDAVYKFDAIGKYLGEITGAAVPQGTLGLFYEASGIAVDNSGGPNKGDLYVAGSENGVVYRFDSAGQLVAELKGSETLAGSFGPRGLAVDGSGDLYVADATDDVVDEFDTSGKFISELRSPEIVDPWAIAVDSSSNVYMLNNAEHRNAVKIEPGGGTSVLNTNSPTTVAVDPGTDHIYVAENHYPSSGRIVEYDESGTQLGVFGEEHVGIGSVEGIATNASGEVYASDNFDGLMAVFGPAVVVPDVANTPVSGLQATSATLNGAVNALEAETGEAGECQFVWGTTEAFGQTAGCEPAEVKGSSPVAVQAELKEKLQPDTTYYYRLQAKNGKGTNNGAESPIQKFTTAGPPTVTNESATNITRTAASLQGQVNPSRIPTTYHFEYGPSEAYGTSIPVPAGDLGAGDEPVSVPAADLTGLQVGATYHYRLVASNECEPGRTCTVAGPDQTFTTVAVAYIDGEYATNVSASSATLNAEVNPTGMSTEYHLEYGTSTAYGQTLTGSIEGTSDVLVSYHRQELSPGTTYHYRIVVHNSFGTVTGPDHTFTTQIAGEESTLPDGRVWELVSPVDNAGALIQPIYRKDISIQAAGAGNAIAYEASDAVGEDPVGKSELSEALSMRSPGGWRTQDITIPRGLPPAGAGAIGAENGTGITLFSSDLLLAVGEQEVSEGAAGNLDRPLSAEATERTPYLRHDLTCEAQPEGCYTPLVTPADVEPSSVRFGGRNPGSAVEVIGGSSDLSHLVLQSPSALTAGAVAKIETDGNGPENLYEWAGGRLQLVNVLPGKTSSTPGATLGYETESGGQLVVAHTVSGDGRFIVWSLGLLAEGGLFVRDMAEKRTVKVGAPGANFQTMSSDGSRIFFREAGELYELNVETAKQTDLTASHGAGEPSAGVQDAILGSSEDGSYVYFVATGVLASSGAVSGADNLYVAHDETGGWSTTYIATLSPEDLHSWYAHHEIREEANPCDCLGVDSNETSARVSPNGRYVTFMSERPLTGYDNIDAISGQPDEEVFLYDAVAKRLVCASCDPTGARPVGVLDGSKHPLVDPEEAWGTGVEQEGKTIGEHWLAGMIPTWWAIKRPSGSASAFHQPRFLSNDGRLFFDSPDALVPQATNGLMDVYEYEPPAGEETASNDSCTTASPTFSERTDGCVSLISGGTSRSESMFYDASENGDDVFFITTSELVAADDETSYALYDAHACTTEAPCSAEPVSPPPCNSGDSCKAAPSPQPAIFGAPASATFSGAGNLAPPSPPVVKTTRKTAGCPKGKARDKHGRCVKRKPRRRAARKAKRATVDRRAES